MLDPTELLIGTAVSFSLALQRSSLGCLLRAGPDSARRQHYPCPLLNRALPVFSGVFPEEWVHSSGNTPQQDSTILSTPQQGSTGSAQRTTKGRQEWSQVPEVEMGGAKDGALGSQFAAQSPEMPHPHFR